MNKDEAMRVVELGRKGFSRAMISMMLKREFRLQRSPNYQTIREILASAGLDDRRDDRQEDVEMQKWSDPYELRARWAERLPAMKRKIRLVVEAGR